MTDLRITEQPGDEARLVREALDSGADTLAVLGGDGTWSSCAAALAASGADARIAFLAGGTGNDFAKNIPAPAHDPRAMAQLIQGGGVDWRVDMGRVDSESRSDWFLNVLGFGFDVAVLERIARGGRLTGPAVYVSAALPLLFSFPGLAIHLDEARSRERATMLVVSNGANFGGAFRIAPQARVDDGLLDLVRIGDVRGVARLPLFARTMYGAHLTHPRVTTARAQSFHLRFDTAPSYEVDGELRRANADELRVRCAPGAIRVLAASAAGDR